jgi:AsmA protein
MKALKWIGISIGILVVLLIAALLIIPLFVDLNTYKPEIEQRVTAATGRTFSIGGNIDLSLFPWAGVALSDIHLGNPPGFSEKEMASLDRFEVRVKLLPLISRDVEVERFVVERPRIVLIRQKDGRTNWEGFGGGPKEREGRSAENRAPKSPSPDTGGGLPIEQLAVGEFAVTGGSLRYLDLKKGTENEVSDLTLRLTDVSLDRPVPLSFSARVDGRPISLEGKVGPLGRQPGKGAMAFDLVAKALSQVEVGVKGRVIDAATEPRFDLSVDLSPFSPRKLAEALGQPIPVETKDPAVLKKLSLKTRLQGSPGAVSLSEGTLVLDDSTASFSAGVSEFEKPRVTFDMSLDRIDLDRYLPPEQEAEKEKKRPKTKEEKAEKPDYGPLRKLALNGSAKVGELKAAGVKMKDVRLTVSAKDGVVRVDPLALAMYGGDVAAGLTLDVRTDRPKTDLSLDVARVAINPLLNDLLKKDFLEGITSAKVGLSFAGDSAGSVLKTLAGSGEFLFRDGAVKGVDLADMARNVKSAFGMAQPEGEKPRTDFTELVVPFSVKKGVVTTPGTVLKSPFIRLNAAGSADLLDKALDIRVEPKLVGTIKGQGDSEMRSGLTVPIAVSGSFSSPRFAPDLEGAVKKRAEDLTSPEGLQQLLPSGKKKEGKDAGKEPLQNLIKELPFGGKN